MASLNKVMIIGRLGKDPELRHTKTGVPVASFSIATGGEKSKDGKEQPTEWHRINAWNKTAELASKFLKKGDQAYIEGKITSRKWKDKQGIERDTTEIMADKLVFLSKRGDVTKENTGVEEDPFTSPPKDDFFSDIPF